MPSPINSYLGLAVQTAKGTENTTNGDFAYFLFSDATVSPIEIRRPLPIEAGGPPMIRDVVQTGVYVAGTAAFIPRPVSIGWILLGLMGQASVVTGTGGGTHTFSWNTDPLDVPYFTVRRIVANLVGEIFTDCRIANLMFNIQGGELIDANVGFVGITPEGDTGFSSWNASAESSNPFLSCASVFTSPTGLTLKPISIQVSAANAMPTDNQFVVGSYYLDDLDIALRAITISTIVKITEEQTYAKLAYKNDGTSTAWNPDMFKESTFTLELKDASGGSVLSFKASQTEDNVAWSIDPLGVRARDNTQLARVTGTVLAATSGDSFTVELLNSRLTAYA